MVMVLFCLKGIFSDLTSRSGLGGFSRRKK